MIPVAANPYPIVMAHRGGGDEAAENSMAAFRRLGEIGIRYLETDAQLTADGQVVLCHDSSLERTYSGEGLISEHTYSEILRLRDADGGQMPLLADVLNEFPELYLNLDAKTNEVAEPMLQVLEDHDALGRTMEAGPEVSTSLGVSAIMRLMAAAQTNSNAETWRVPGPRRRARAAQVPDRTRGIRVLDPRLVATSHAAGLAVHVWTINDPDQMVNLVQMGVDGIITDRPSMAKEIFQDMGVWAE